MFGTVLKAELVRSSYAHSYIVLTNHLHPIQSTNSVSPAATTAPAKTAPMHADINILAMAAGDGWILEHPPSPCRLPHVCQGSCRRDRHRRPLSTVSTEE